MSNEPTKSADLQPRIRRLLSSDVRYVGPTKFRIDVPGGFVALSSPNAREAVEEIASYLDSHNVLSDVESIQKMISSMYPQPVEPPTTLSLLQALATEEMCNFGHSAITQEHLCLALCEFRRAVSEACPGASPNWLENQVAVVQRAFASLGLQPGDLVARIRSRLVPGHANWPENTISVIPLDPGAIAVLGLTDPEKPEAAHFLAKLLENPSPVVASALAALFVQPSALKSALLTTLEESFK
jgi:hypothetical protein